MNSPAPTFVMMSVAGYLRMRLPDNGFLYEETVGTYKVNMPYLGLVLRLADILDFDRERTPDALYRTVHFTNDVSLTDWENHRSVEGWIIEEELIQFNMSCEHPVYQRAALDFMGWIDYELASAHALVRDFPTRISQYRIGLPLRVDRSGIKPRNDAYIYHDLEFSLSRDEIVKLLMTDKLYESTSLCVRELLQNSLDALRHRQSVIKRDNGSNWGEGRVLMEHTLDAEQHEVLRCIDNGVGMDEEIVTRYLTKVGRSYYRSPEFDQERLSLKAAGVD